MDGFDERLHRRTSRLDGRVDGLSPLSRRAFLRVAGGAGLSLAAAACGGTQTTGPTTAGNLEPRKIGGELNLVCWAGYDDPAIVQEFGELYDVKINAKQHAGDEELTAILAAARPGEYDIAVPDTPWIEIFRRRGWLAQLDPADYPLRDYYSRFRDFEQCQVDGRYYGLVSRWGYYGIIYNTDQVSAEEAAGIEVMYDPKYRGKVVLFDWYLPNMGMIGRMLGLEQPYDASDVDLERIRQKLFELRPQVAAIQPTPNDTITALANQTGWLSFGGEWQQVLLAEQGNPIEVVVPRQGGVSWTEGVCMLKSSQNPRAARAYLRYITSPQGAAKLAWAQAFHATVPNRRAVEYLQEEQVEALKLDRPANVDRLLSNVATRKIPRNEKNWQEIWDEFKALR